MGEVYQKAQLPVIKYIIPGAVMYSTVTIVNAHLKGAKRVDLKSPQKKKEIWDCEVTGVH